MAICNRKFQEHVPVTLAKIKSKSKKGFSFLETPSNHLNYQVMIVKDTFLSNGLQKANERLHITAK